MSLLAGLPLAVVLSWIFDITPEGLVVTGEEGVPETQSFRHSRPKPVKLKELGLIRKQLTPLIGRGEECGIVRRRLEEAKSGKGGILLICGEPGVGKTRLAEEAVGMGSEMGVLPLLGHAYEEQRAPFIVATEIIEEVAQILPEKGLRNVLGSNAAEIALLVPELRRTFPDIPGTLEVPAEQQQRFLFKAVLGFLKRLCEVSPLVVLLDDLHWVDESSAQLLEYLSPHLVSLPVLFVITYRDADIDMGEPFKRVLVNLMRSPVVNRIVLNQLSLADVTALLAEASGSSPPSQLAELIHRETEGNAFFVQSVFQDLKEEGKLFDRDGRWLTEVDIDRLAVPDSVRLVSTRRFERLGQSAQDILTIAAVVGLRFRVRVLEQATAQPDAVMLAIEAAEQAQLIIPSQSGFDLRYEFVHALARQTLLTKLSAVRRQHLHLQVAKAIEATHADELERHAAELAFHLIEAGNSADRDFTIHWVRVAGDNAKAATAMDEAAGFFTAGLSMLHQDEDESRADFLHQRGSVQLSLGRKQEFLSDLHEAWLIYKSLKISQKAARVVLELAYLLVWNAKPADAFNLTTEAFELLGDEDSSARCRLLSAQAVAQDMASEFKKSQNTHKAAVAMARNLDDPRLVAETLQNQSLLQWLILNSDAELFAHEAAGIRREMQQEWHLGQCLWMEKAGLIFLGRFDEAEEIDRELRPLAERNGDYGSLAIMAMMTGIAEQARGNLEACSQQFRASVDLFEEGGFPWGFISEGHFSANQLLLGDKPGARKAFDRAWANRLIGVSWSGADVCYWLSGKAHLGDTDIRDAYETVRDGLPDANEVMSGGSVLLLEGCIEALVVAGEYKEAAKLYPAICNFVEQQTSLLAFTYGLHERFAGMAAAAGGEWNKAEKHYLAALNLAENLPHRVDQARLRYWYARMLLDKDGANEIERAERMLKEAQTLSEEMGMHGLLEAIQAIQIDRE